MKKIILGFLVLAMATLVIAECITEENKAVKNGVDFPNYCADENNLVKNYCSNDSVEQEYINCDCVSDICVVPIENQTVIENETVNNTVVCEELWQCSEWSDCNGLIKERACADLNGCNTFEGKPSEIQGCSLAIPWYNTWKGIVVILALVVVAVLVGYFLLKKKKEEGEIYG